MAKDKKLSREFMSVSSGQGGIIVNASSHEDACVLRTIMSMLGVEIDVKYDGMCG